MGGAIHERIQNSHTQIESAKFFPRRLSRETRCRVLEEGRKEGSQRIENRESRRGKKKSTYHPVLRKSHIASYQAPNAHTSNIHTSIYFTTGQSRYNYCDDEFWS